LLSEQNSLKYSNRRNQVLPEHPTELLASPSPAKPVLQVQVNDPTGASEQTAFESHTDGVMAHSLMSANQLNFILSWYKQRETLELNSHCCTTVE